MQDTGLKSQFALIRVKYPNMEKGIICLNLLKSVCFCLLFIGCLVFSGCSSFSPPTDYYQKTIEMEGYGEQSRNETRKVASDSETHSTISQTTKIIRKPSEEAPIVEVLPKPDQDKDDSSTIAKGKKLGEKEKIPQIDSPFTPLPPISSSESGLNLEPIAISSDVIKTALEIAGINVRNVELVNGRIGGSKNSVRVNFICESSNAVNEKFFTICAVVYHLNKSSNTVDVVIGIAEDSQINLLGVLQSNTEDITAWMDNKITRMEWFSRITKKML